MSSDHDHQLPALTAAERERYRRHLILPGVGMEGQQRLKAARVLVVGAGGLGSPVALYLAAAGVGTLGLVDNDVVDVTNLQRQLLHGTSDIGRSKLDSARDRLYDVNPHVVVKTHAGWLTSANALDIMREYDVVVDGTDNFATRYLVNDACVLLGIPNVYGSVFRFDGQASVFATPDGPCYRCLYPEPPPPDMVPNCAEGGVFRTLRIDRNPACPACGTREITQLIDYDQFCGTPGLHSNAETRVREVEPANLRDRLARGEPLQLIDVREPAETTEGIIDGARCIPLATLEHEAATLSPDVPTVLVCRSGMRSASAARQLMARGFTRVESLAGGMMRWFDG
jgi:adenylyltransferase/sulfurtransferase